VAIVSMDLCRCRAWDLRDRLEEFLTEETCREEIESVRAHGQLVPAVEYTAKEMTSRKAIPGLEMRRILCLTYGKCPI
jgi:hypothetical protein